MTMIIKRPKVEIKVRVDRDLAEQLKRAAKEREVALGGLIERALEFYFLSGGAKVQEEQRRTV